MAQVFGPQLPMWETQVKLLTPDFSRVQLWPLQPLREWSCKWTLSLPPCYSAFQIHKQIHTHTRDLFEFFDKQNYRLKERGRDVFYLLAHSPSSCNCVSWPNLKPGVRSVLWASQMGAGAQRLEPASAAFPGCKQRDGWEMEQSWHKLASTRGSLHMQREDSNY